MYYFKNTAGDTFKLRFAHKGGKKGSDQKPGRPAKFTMCKIIDGNNNIVSTGIASPVREVAEIVPARVDPSQFCIYYGKRLLRTVRTGGGEVIALLRGDSFSRKIGRYESARQALDNGIFDKNTRRNAIDSLLGFNKEVKVVEENIIELTDIVVK